MDREKRPKVCKPAATVDQLRADIDSGRTGDKVPGRDLAAAPLGTDEEAAGTPIPGVILQETRESELSLPSHRQQKAGIGHAWILIGFVGILLLAILGWGTYVIGK